MTAVLVDNWTDALWVRILFVNSHRWTKLAEALTAPTAAPPFQSNTMDEDFAMNEYFEMSDAPSPEYFVPDMDVDGQAPPPGLPLGPAGSAGPHV